MFKSYIKIAWRNILKNRFHSAINIFGLSIGIAFTLLIVAYIWNELQVNRNLKDAGSQYILQSKWKDPDMGQELTSPGPLAKALREQYPALVADYYRWDGITSNVSKDNRHFREGLQLCDSTMLNMYGFQLVEGNAATALKEPFSVVITEDRAVKYFGKTGVIGQTLTVESFSGTKHDFKITGVMKAPSQNSVTYLNNDNNNQFYIPVNTMSFFGRDIEQWGNQNIVGFIKLQKGVQPGALARPIAQLIKQNAPARTSANLQTNLVPLKEYYLQANNGLVKKMLYTISFIALFILLMAIINFINISISKSSARIKEIGVRKTLGGLKKQLLQQFLIESIMLVFLSMIFSLLIYYFVNPAVSDVLGKQIPKLLSFHISYFLIPAALVLLIGILAGIYPALILSAAKAVDSLKGKLRSVDEHITVRKSLLGFQFFTAAVVLIGAIIISKQVALFFSKDLGYEKDYIVSAQLPREWSAEGVNRVKAKRNEFALLPEVSEVSLSYEIPNGNNIASIPMYRQETDSTQAIPVQALVTDERYAGTYKIPLIAGMFFSQPYNPADSFKIVINETACKSFGFNNAADAIGKVMRVPGGSPLTISGVTADFHFGSMQQQIKPLTFFNVDLWTNYRFLSFKLKPGNVSSSVGALQRKWSALFPGVAFEYNFMDESLAKLYQSEIQLKKAANAATILAIIIAILGVVGLVSVSIQKRIKEIGIRKVLGAGSLNIIALFLKEFLPVIVIAGVVSIPVAYYVMQGWLNDYTYKVNINAVPFLVSIVFLALITTLLISIQIARAGEQNPVKNLRTE